MSKIASQYISVRLIKMYKRFFADIQLDNNEVITEVSLDGIDIDNAVENKSLVSNKEDTVELLNKSTDTSTKNFIERVIQV